MIVFDASVLIAYLDGNDDLHAEAETLLAAAIDEDFGKLTDAGGGPRRAGSNRSDGSGAVSSTRT